MSWIRRHDKACATCAALQAENARLRAQEALQAEQLQRLEAELTILRPLRAEIERLKAEIERLLAQLGQNSTNSHRPPSADPPGSAKPKRQSPSGRRRGGQHGHEGKTRSLLPPERVDRLVVCRPQNCRHCGTALSGRDRHPARHQVLELPPLQPEVSEYQMESLCCPKCGKITRADLPPGVPERTYGPRLQSLVALLTGVYRLSRRNAEVLLADLFGVPISLGSVVGLERATSAALAGPVDEAQAAVKKQAVAYADETGWREGGKRAWLWVAVTGVATVFLIRCSRGAKVARELLGETFRGTLVSDRYSAYTWVGRYYRQLCWAHLVRDFRAMVDVGGEVKAIGEDLLECARQLFHWWHRVRDGTLRRSSLQSYLPALRRDVRRLLERGASSPHRKTAGTCRALLELEPALWTFIRAPGLEPTNNDAERALRGAVIWRKTSFGSQNEAGSLYVERMLTVVATLRQQGRPVLDYLTAACHAANTGSPAPSLIAPPNAQPLPLPAAA